MTMINGVNFTRTGDPQADLKTYMNARGIDEATAKAELEAQFGIPQMIQANDVDEDSSLAIDATDSVSNTSSSQATDRAGLEKEIGTWRAKLKQATDAGDQWGVTQAQAQLKTLQEKAYSWDNSTSSTTSTSDTSETTETTDTSDAQATDRAGLEKEIGTWRAKLKQATDAGDQWGITQAQNQLKTLQEKAYNWDNGISS